jgi:hypothetical protein
MRSGNCLASRTQPRNRREILRERSGRASRARRSQSARIRSSSGWHGRGGSVHRPGEAWKRPRDPGHEGPPLTMAQGGEHAVEPFARRQFLHPHSPLRHQAKGKGHRDPVVAAGAEPALHELLLGPVRAHVQLPGRGSFRPESARSFAARVPPPRGESSRRRSPPFDRACSAGPGASHVSVCPWKGAGSRPARWKRVPDRGPRPAMASPGRRGAGRGWRRCRGAAQRSFRVWMGFMGEFRMRGSRGPRWVVPARSGPLEEARVRSGQSGLLSRKGWGASRRSAAERWIRYRLSEKCPPAER